MFTPKLGPRVGERVSINRGKVPALHDPDCRRYTKPFMPKRICILSQVHQVVVGQPPLSVGHMVGHKTRVYGVTLAHVHTGSFQGLQAMARGGFLTTSTP